MQLLKINWNPTDRQLRQFGLTSLFALPFVGWAWGADSRVVTCLAIIGFCMAIAGVVIPKSLKFVFLALSMVTFPIGLVVSEMVLPIVYYAVIVPIGLTFQFTGRDVLGLTLDRSAPTYWQPKKPAAGPHTYYRQS